MMDYLRQTSDDVQKLDAVKRIHELAERFAPDMQWFLDTMNQVHTPAQKHHIWVAHCADCFLIFQGQLVALLALHKQLRFTCDTAVADARNSCASAHADMSACIEICCTAKVMQACAAQDKMCCDGCGDDKKLCQRPV